MLQILKDFAIALSTELLATIIVHRHRMISI